MPSNQSESNYFWGISEFSVAALQCRTCVSDDIMKLGEAIGYGLLISTSILVVMVSIMCIYVECKKAQKKNKRKTGFRKLNKEKEKERE